MKITAKNYVKTIDKVGFENLPEVLKKSHSIIMAKTDDGKDWSLYDNDADVKRVFDLAFEKFEEFIDNKGELSGIDKITKGVSGKENVYDPFNEVQLMETFIAFNGKILIKKEIKKFIDDLQKAIKDKKIRKHSPFAPEVKRMQKAAIYFYNQNGNAHKLLIADDFVKDLEEAILVYFNSRRDVEKAEQIDPVELSGVENAENNILPSTEFEKMEFPTIGFTGKWLNLMGDPCAGFTAMVFGKPKMGKSYLAVDFAGYLAKNFGKVLYVAKEEKFGVTFAQKLKDKDAGHENLIISDSIPTDLSPYAFIFLDSINSLELNPEDLRKLKEQNPVKSFVFVFQTTKTGNFRGANTFQHDVDIVIEIPERGKAIQFGRFNQGGEMSIFDDEKQPQAEYDGFDGIKKGRYSIKDDVHMAVLRNPMHDKLMIWASSKAENWKDVRALDVTDHKLLDRLPLVDEKDYSPIETPNSELPEELHGKIFILQKDKKVYFIDTQGYNYSRFALELLNYNPTEEGSIGATEGKKKYPAWTTPKHLNMSDHSKLKHIYDLYKKGEFKEAYDYALNSSDTIIREEIPGDIWKKLGGQLTKTGEEKLKKKKASSKQKVSVATPPKKTLVFHGGTRTMKEVMERAWDLELTDGQYMEILEIAQEVDSNFVELMDNLNFEFNEFFAIMKKAMNEWESKNGKLATVNRDKYDPKLFANRSDEENPAFIFSMTSNKVLSDAIKGEFDLVYMVRRELANRGMDSDGKWVGFEKAKEVHRIG